MAAEAGVRADERPERRLDPVEVDVGEEAVAPGVGAVRPVAEQERAGAEQAGQGLEVGEAALVHALGLVAADALVVVPLALYALAAVGMGRYRLAESGVKRDIPGPCGKAPAVIGNPGWGDGGRDASGAGRTGAAGRAQGRGAEPAGDRAGARPGGLDGQPRAAAERAAQGRLPARPRRGLPPRAAAAPGRPGARRAARPVRARAPAGRLDAGADRRLAQARRGARASSGLARDDLRLHPPPGT